MSQAAVQQNIFEEKSVWKILLHIAPPVMLAQLIQAMYNIVDSYFVGRFSEDGLTALSVVYPIQLIAIAVAVGTGVGVNTLMSRHYAHQEQRRANETAGTGVVLALISWGVFALLSVLLMRPYVQLSADAPAAVEYAVTYGTIVCVGSLGLFLESIWTKIHQAGGNMRLPMIAQIAGALTNIVLDPILIFGLGFVPALGVAGAAYATVAGQIVAAVITSSGFPETAQGNSDVDLHEKDLQVGIPVHLHADAVHRLYCGAQHDSGGVFRCGGDGSRPVL